MVWAISSALALLAIWALFNPFVGLIAVLAIIFVRPGELYPILDTIHVQRTFTLIVLLSFLVHQRRLAVPNVSKALLFLWGAMFCTVPFAFWQGGAFEHSVDFGKVIMYHLLILNLATNARRLRIVLITICVLVAWLGVWSTFLYYAGDYQVRMGIERAVGLNSFSDDPNALGITLVTALPLFLLFLRKDAGRIRWVMMPLTAICLWTVVLTGSRTSYIVFAVMALAYASLQKYRVPAIFAVLTLIAVLWVSMPEQYRGRIETVDNLQADGSYQGRVQVWGQAWEMFKSNPLTGIGVGEFVDVHGARTGHWLNVHSLYFQLLSEMGSLGFCAFVVFLTSVIRQNFLIRRQSRLIPQCPSWFQNYPRACNLALLGLLVAGYSSHSLGRDTWYLLAGLTAAAGLVAKAEMQSEKLPKEVESSVKHKGSAELSEVRV
jgi:O-antigen ligase